ncbi:hypothetical protein [Rhodoferax sp.]|uniref:hypothetical protein n=1 Tax=Rhodoferax sp. TaxID=50421 RepID=UPI002ACEB2F8|nr:hypothetical protein [Rhodoferax sp.]MDZ7919883.1 hypothetical protein [Rhodoferax sp.]
MKTDNVPKESFWKTVFKTPSAARTATVVMLIVWGIAAVWGWFFVETTVLRDSQTARDYVEWATKVFPWLDNIRRLVPQAEKGLYLHSVYTVALAPTTFLSQIVLMHHVGKLSEEDRTLRDFLITAVFCLLSLAGMLWILYEYILFPSFGRLHRTGYSFVASPITAPCLAPFFIIGLWSLLAGITYFTSLTVRKLISKESRHG